ncbi:MAG: glycosyltransferase family 2 protein [Thermaurantimonas sp.]
MVFTSKKIFSIVDPIDGFSILIPTWNNFQYLRLCLNAIIKYSSLKHQIILAINEGYDGTLEFADERQISYVHFKENVGVCIAVNAARSLAVSDYLVYMNDDMVPLPGWDLALMEEVRKSDSKLFMISSTMIEPYETNNPCVIVQNFGSDCKNFDENAALLFAKKYSKNNWKGASWPPFVVHKDVWDIVGGFGIEYSPGFYSDPDFSLKLYLIGVRHFIGCGKSLVYHFGTKSTKRVKKNNGKDLFLLKWGITASDFYFNILNLGDDFETEKNQSQINLFFKIKYFIKSFKALLNRPIKLIK